MKSSSRPENGISITLYTDTHTHACLQHKQQHAWTMTYSKDRQKECIELFVYNPCSVFVSLSVISGFMCVGKHTI